MNLVDCVREGIKSFNSHICVTKTQGDQDILDLFGTKSVNFENGTMSLNFEKDNIHLTNESLKIEYDAKEASNYNLPFQTLTTISKSLIWLEFVLDNAVCFTEFMVVWS